MKRKGKIIGVAKIGISGLLVTAAVACILLRIPQCFKSQNPAALAAAAVTLSSGEYKLDQNGDNDNENQSSTKPSNNEENKTQTTTQQTTVAQVKKDKSDYYDSFSKSHDNENKNEVAEKTYGEDGTKCESCYVKNKTGLDIDFEKELNDKLPFSVNKGVKSPQVLIYHTHTSEGYLDEDVDFFYDSYYSRTLNNAYNVTSVGDAITKSLTSNGISTIHDKTVHDNTYNVAYERSVETVNKDMKNNKDIKVCLDIHRDAIGTDSCKVKPVFEYNGKKAAQIMILAGCDDGTMGFENWKNNLSFALKIQNTAEEMYPGMTRPLDFDYFAYNEYVCDGSLLIEVGSDANSIEEAEYTGSMLGKVLAKVLG